MFVFYQEHWSSSMTYIPLVTDLQFIHQCCLVIINERVHHANFCCHSCGYKVGHKNLIL